MKNATHWANPAYRVKEISCPLVKNLWSSERKTPSIPDEYEPENPGERMISAAISVLPQTGAFLQRKPAFARQRSA